EGHDVVRVVHAARPHLRTMDAPALAVVAYLRRASRLHEGGVRTVVRLGETERRAQPAVQDVVAITLELLRRSKLLEHDDERVVADDRVLGLKVIEETETLCGEMFADHG